MKAFSGKAKQSVQNYLNQNLVLVRILENSYKAESLNTTFFSFCKFLSDEVETAFCESETMLRKLIVESLVCWELFRMCFSAF